ncbi:FxsA family protein [Azospirillum soli]|uniref:FxsA family protein n=1 Tax=Azospirillum soli TaxID=1304799 RepID=UPI001AE45D95|nr:FxsA family protein [Azospirillum soli]MBP2311615.1 UPF0716 protein FxsA [Azospirillum soli]
MNPLLLILLLPIAEIAVFIEVGDWIGAWPTVGLVVLSAVLGSVLVRRQGLTAMKRAQEAAERGEFPVGAVFEGFCIVVAGVLLIIPGFLTDVVGLLLFVPPVRNALGRWLFERLRGSGSFHVWTGAGAGGMGTGPQPHRPQPGTIEVDYREVEPEGAEPDDAPRLTESRWRPPGSSHPNGRPDDHR